MYIINKTDPELIEALVFEQFQNRQFFRPITGDRGMAIETSVVESNRETAVQETRVYQIY